MEKESDVDDNYMGDIDEGYEIEEVTDDDSSEDYREFTPRPRPLPRTERQNKVLDVITLDDSDDEVVIIDERRRDQMVAQQWNCDPCIVEMVPANLDLPLREIQTLWSVNFVFIFASNETHMKLLFCY